MDEKTAKTERTQLLFFWLLSSTLLLLMGNLLSGCHSKKAPQRPPATIIYADTTRTKLVHRAAQSADSLTIFHLRNQQTVATYEKDVAAYDSIQLALP